MSAQPGGGGAGEPGEGSGDAAGSGGGAFPAVATKMDLVQDILDRNRSGRRRRARARAARTRPRAAARRRRRSRPPARPPARRSILHQIRVNHEAQRPEGLSRNFLLIKEVNSNIDEARRRRRSAASPPPSLALQRPLANAHTLCSPLQVMGMYGSISDDFVTFMAQRPGSGSAADQQGGSSFGADADGANGATQPPAAAAPEAPAPAGAVAS
jgi:hypothetical protein